MVNYIEIEGYKYQLSTRKTDFSCTKIIMNDFVKDKKMSLYLSAPFSLVMDNYGNIEREIRDILKLPYWSLRIISVTFIKEFRFTYVIE